MSMGEAIFSNGATVLIVDDAPENIDMLGDVLRCHYKVKAATNGERALRIARGSPHPDLILLDILMPGMSGYEVCQLLKENPSTADVPVIFVTAMDDVDDERKGLELGAVDYITKPYSPSIVLARVNTHLTLKRVRNHLEDLVEARTRELELTKDATIVSLASLAETRDLETGNHIHRTQRYVRVLAEHLRDHPRFSKFLSPNIIDMLYKTAPLHDIGKVGVPDEVLLKPGRLTPEEFEIMKKHTTLGRLTMRNAAAMMGGNSFFDFAGDIAESHHERWDGNGYPHGLKAEAIPFSGRLMALADVYDALICTRVYKPSMGHDKAREIIIAGRASQFDPSVVDAFIENEDVFQAIAREFEDKS